MSAPIIKLSKNKCLMISPNYEEGILQIGKPVKFLENGRLSKRLAGYKFIDQFSNLWWIKVNVDHMDNEHVRDISIFSEYCIRETGGVFYETKKQLMCFSTESQWADDSIHRKYLFSATVKGFEAFDMSQEDASRMFLWSAFSILNCKLSSLDAENFRDIYYNFSPQRIFEKDLKNFAKDLE